MGRSLIINTKRRIKLPDKKTDPEKLLELLSKKENIELAKNLIQLDDETFKLAKEIFVTSRIKFFRGPVSDYTLNIDLIKELNTAQLKFLFGLIDTELKERE